MAAVNNDKLLARLIAEGRERPWLEFKQNFVDPNDIGQYISALSNAALLQGIHRAYLIYGIADQSLTRVGTSFKPHLLKVGNEGFINWLSRKLDPQVKFEFLEFTIDQLNFVVAEIEPSYFKPVKFDGIAYVRIGEHKKKLADYPEHERSLWLATGTRKFEQAIAYSNASSERIKQLLQWEEYYRLVQRPVPVDFKEVIRNFLQERFLSDELDDTFSITNLGAILWAKDISTFPSIERKSVRVIQYDGIDAKNTVGEFEDRSGYAVGFEKLNNLIYSKTIHREVIKSGVRRSIPLIPEIAIREVIANALIHQDLSAGGSGPIIEIYSNRIDVSNPGNLLGQLERIIDDPPRSRNELLAKSMRTLGLCEERGKGIDKAITAIEDVAVEGRIYLPAPLFRNSDNGFTVTLYGAKQFKFLTREEKQRTCYHHCVICFLRGEYMNNSSLRERFSLHKDDYQAISSIITEAVRSQVIAVADSKQGRKHARYIPVWATNT